MKTIYKNSQIEIEIKKSRFIGYSFKINTFEEIESNLQALRKQYYNATHVCYAFVFENIEKCSDDGEPSGTAGIPILDVIKKNGLSNILVVVVRYFGGIKLGAGGLNRAYSKCCSTAIKESNIVELQLYNVYNVYVEYQNVQAFSKIVKDYDVKILNTSFNDSVVYNVATFLDDSIFNKVSNKIEVLDKKWM